ncbi:MAG: hypothetical protein IKE03_06440 [Blautia sp.]|nr:hypothetical protein [Blautia sp.]
MSQKKVDLYKEQKANRAQIIRREKRILRLEKTIAALVCVVLVGWIGFSIYSQATRPSDDVTVVDTQINVTALNDYISGLDADVE